MDIRYLRDDLIELIDTFRPAERGYAEDGKRISREMMGSDHADTLLLRKEDGGDGKAVCSITTENARDVWGYGTTGHFFPGVRDLVRLSAFFRLDFYRALALVLKGCWEKFFAEKMGWPGNDVALEDILFDRDAIKQHKGEFQPDCAEIFRCFEEHGRQAGNAGYDEHTFLSLVREMVLNDLHLAPNSDRDLKAFADARSLEYKLLREGGEKLQEEFWIYKCRWLEFQGELEEQLMLLEKRRLQNANITHQWLSVFGEVYVDLEEQIWRLRMLERRIQILEENPDLTQEELEQKVMDLESDEQRRLEELRYQLALAPWLRHPEGGGTITEESLVEYQQKCKRVLRQLWMLLYPERLERHPFYHKLTEQQRQKLRELWNSIPKIRPDELGYQANQVGYWNRSLERLLDALTTAESILANAGLNINVALVIQGDTLAEKNAWLKGEIENLKGDIGNVKAEIRALNKDKDLLEKYNILSSPETYEETRAKIRERAQAYREQADELERLLEGIMAKKKTR